MQLCQDRFAFRRSKSTWRRRPRLGHRGAAGRTPFAVVRSAGRKQRTASSARAHGGGQFGDRVHVDALPVPWTQLCRECKERGHSAVDTRSICFESPVEIGNDTRIVRGGFGSTPFPQTVNSPKVPPNVKSTDHPCRDPQLHGENGILTPLGNGAISHTRTQTPLAAVPQKR